METAGVDSGAMTRLGVHGAALEESASAPEWIELIPAGVFRGRDGRGPFKLANAGAVIEATRALRMSAGIPIDYDHATDFAAPEGRPAPAAGWINELIERDGAIWGRVRWTLHGAAAVTTREYRYVSPVFEHRKDGVIVRLLRAALTNNPNLYLTAISSRATGAAAQDGANNAESEGELMNLPLTEIRTLLGLGSEAGVEEILESIRALTAAPEAVANAGRAAERNVHDDAVDLGRYVPLAHFQKAVGELSELRALHAR
jgi:phage I-like protein